MAILNIPQENKSIETVSEIKSFLNHRSIFFDQWQADKKLTETASQDEILDAYSTALKPYMHSNGYKVADVININSKTENYDAIRAKFLQEHTHTEDEVRFFVDGEGLFWFNLEGDKAVFNVLCQAGDLISVPANTKHWFDAGEKNPSVKAIRIFIDSSGWVPHYTGNNIAEKFL